MFTGLGNCETESLFISDRPTLLLQLKRGKIKVLAESKAFENNGLFEPELGQLCPTPL